MTNDLRKAAQQALDALENHTAIKHPQQRAYRDDAIEALRAALQDEGKPVAYIRTEDGLLAKNDGGTFGPRWTPLYTTPPQRPLLTLTELQYLLVDSGLVDKDAIEDSDGYDNGESLCLIDDLYYAIERKVRGEE